MCANGIGSEWSFSGAIFDGARESELRLVTRANEGGRWLGVAIPGDGATGVRAFGVDGAANTRARGENQAGLFVGKFKGDGFAHCGQSGAGDKESAVLRERFQRATGALRTTNAYYDNAQGKRAAFEEMTS